MQLDVWSGRNNSIFYANFECVYQTEREKKTKKMNEKKKHFHNKMLFIYYLRYAYI